MATKARKPRKKQSNRKAKVSRADHILDVAIRLFNERGVQNVGSHHIAAFMRISTGNLHYHYKRKADVLSATFDRMAAALQPLLTNPPVGRIDHHPFALLHRIFQTLWEYRFIFGSLDFIILKNPEIYPKYLQLQELNIKRLTDLHAYLVSEGLAVKIAAPNSPYFVYSSVWLLWLSWIRTEMVALASSPNNGDFSVEAIIRRGIRHHLSILTPYHDATITTKAMRLALRKSASKSGSTRGK